MIRFLMKKSFPLFKLASADTRLPWSSLTWSFVAYGTARWKRKPRRVRSSLLVGTIRFRQVYVCYSMSSDNRTDFRKGGQRKDKSSYCIWKAKGDS